MIQIGKNKHFILQWQNTGNRNNSSLTIGKSFGKKEYLKIMTCKNV